MFCIFSSRERIKKRILAFLICATFIYSEVGLCISAEPDIYAPDFEIKNLKITTSDETKIEGTFEIVNNTDKEFSGLYYATEVYVLSQNSSNLMNKEYFSFGLGSKERKVITFRNLFKTKIPKGTYSVISRIYNRTGIDLAFNLKKIGTMGTDIDFLAYQPLNCYFLIGTQKKPANSGPSFKVSETPVLTATFKNISTKKIDATAFINVFKRERISFPIPLKTDSSAKFSFEAGEQKSIDIKLPAMTDPESYQAVITMKNAIGSAISGEIEARYVVRGIGAKIINSTFTKLNEILTITYGVIGPADGSELPDSKIVVTIKDRKKNTEIYSNEIIIKLGQILYKNKHEIPIDAAVKMMTATISVVHKDKILDEAKYEYPSSTTIPILDPIKLSFVDVVGTKFENAVNELFDMGYIKGYEDNTFRPLNNLKRAEFSTIMCYLLNRNNEFDAYNKTSLFADVPTSFWGIGFINIVKNSKLIMGYPDGTFKPENNMNYGEACTILTRYLNGGKDIESNLIWPDNYVAEAEKLELLTGIEFKPLDKIIRGDVAIMASNALKVKNAK